MEKLALFGGKPVRDNPLAYGRQYIDEDDIRAVTEVLQSDFLTCGPKIGELEKKLCDITGAAYAAALSNGTAALHAACAAARIGPGDEVITTPVTFAASANCALYCGARPVFADIDPETYNISPQEIERHITDKTRAVVAVDFTGQAVQLDEILALCRKHDLTLIEDAAHSIGTLYRGKAVGGIADMTTFSFHPVKTVTAGEGGAVLTNREDLYQQCKLFASHGITRDPALMSKSPDGPWYYEMTRLGFNYRMTDIQAALAVSQLEKLSRFKARRAEIVKRYDNAFSAMPQVTVQREIPQSDSARHLYLLRLKPETLRASRREIFDALAAENIRCNVHYIPVYYFPYYQKMGYQKGICPQAEKLYEEMMTLPLYYAMTDGDADDVIHAVGKVLAYYQK